MKQLLPYFFRKIGIALFIISFLLNFIKTLDQTLLFPMSLEMPNQQSEVKSEITNEDSSVLFTSSQHQLIKTSVFWLALTGLLLYSFSKEKVDDEFLAKLRADALLKSFTISWILSGAMILIKGATKVDILAFLQIQMFLYVIVYAYTKKIKYAE